MRTPAAAVAWEFRQRHRQGLMAVAATILALGAIRIALLTNGSQLRFHEVTFVLLSTLPLAASFFYLVAVFTFGLSGDLAARESMYPPRMLTLPVSSAALAGWPMLYGCVSMMALWFAIRIAGTFPPGLDPPRFWPALFAASLLAWIQALTWMPYPLRGMRVGVAIVLLLMIDVVVFTALQYGASERTMLLLLAPLVPLAFATARSAVARARRGDVPDWRIARLAPARRPVAATGHFRTPARAQLWLEWSQYGRTLPVMVAIVLPPGLSLLFLFRETPMIVAEIVALSLLLPPFMAVFVAAAVGKSSSGPAASYGIPAFIATRPVGDRALVVAKWQAALLSTLAAWAIVAVVVPVGLLWADAAAPVVDVARTLSDALGVPRAVLLGLLILATLIGSTWKQLVQSLSIAMSGYDRAVKGMAFSTLVLVTAGFLALGWILDSRQRTIAAWSALPWLLVALVAVKLALTVAVLRRAAGLGLFTRKQLIIGAGAWDLCVFALYGVLAAILPEIVVRRDLLILIAILAVPITRVAAAPLAVARNRHR